MNYFLLDQNNPLNAWAITATQSFRSPFLDSFFINFTNFASPIGLTVIALVAAIILRLHGKRAHMAQFALTLIVGSILVGIIKVLVQLPRPAGALIHESGFSFVSGHTTFAVIFFTLLAYSYESHIKSKFLRIAFAAGAVFLSALVGFSRIYLGVHYFTDVIGGLTLGVAVSGISIFVFNLIKSKNGSNSRR